MFHVKLLPHSAATKLTFHVKHWKLPGKHKSKWQAPSNSTLTHTNTTHPSAKTNCMNFKNIRDKIQHLLQSTTIDARDFITGITHVSRETPTILKHNKTTHPTTKATWSHPLKTTTTNPNKSSQTNSHVPRETLHWSLFSVPTHS